MEVRQGPNLGCSDKEKNLQFYLNSYGPISRYEALCLQRYTRDSRVFWCVRSPLMHMSPRFSMTSKLY
jgi:hypothetical protein